MSRKRHEPEIPIEQDSEGSEDALDQAESLDDIVSEVQRSRRHSYEDRGYSYDRDNDGDPEPLDFND